MSFPTGPRKATLWAARERALADASGIAPEQLAGMVETELDRCDGVLFTATPAQELDEVSRWQRLADAAWCGQVRTVVAMHNRASVTQRQFLGCEVSLALSITQAGADELVATALLAGQLPGLVEAVEAGMLTVRHAMAVLAVLPGCGLTVEQQHAVLTVALARCQGLTPVRLKDLLRRLVVQCDAAAAQAREQVATRDRHVRFAADGDGQGVIVARGPLATVEAVRAALEHGVAAGAVPGDERSTDQRTYDLLVQLLTGGWTWTQPALDTATVAEPVAEPEPGSAPVPVGGWHATVVVPFSVAAGGDLELAEIPGLGAVLPSTARELLGQCATITQVAVDEHGHVLAVSARYPDPRPLRRTLIRPAGCSSCAGPRPGSARPRTDRATPPGSGCGAGWRPATARACSPPAAALPAVPTRTIATSGRAAGPATTTSSASARGTTWPSTACSPSTCTPTAPCSGPPAAGGPSSEHSRATDLLPSAARPAPPR